MMHITHTHLVRLFAVVCVLSLIVAASAWALSLAQASSTLQAGTTVYLPIAICADCPPAAPTATATAQPTATPDPNTGEILAMRLRMVELVNAARTNEPLCQSKLAAIDANLMHGAQAWSEKMLEVGYMHSFAYPGGETWYADHGYDGYGGGAQEAIGVGANADDMFAGWWESPLHRSIILESCYEGSNVTSWDFEIGVGVADGTWTLAIGRRDSAESAATTATMATMP
jgi:uncharacterized protein YkwD